MLSVDVDDTIRKLVGVAFQFEEYEGFFQVTQIFFYGVDALNP